MISFVFMDGLGGRPETTFGSLKKILNILGYRAEFANTHCINSRKDRVNEVLDECYAELNYMNLKCPDKKNKLFLIGESAGGGAVLEVAQRLQGGNSFAGVILLSPCMPFGFNYMTWKLFWVMICNLFYLVFGLPVRLTENQYGSLIKPVDDSKLQVIVNNRQTISGREARELAFFPPKFKPLNCPVLYIYGNQDHWINPKAHRKLCARFKETSKLFEYFEIHGAGHLTLASDGHEIATGRIMEWIEKYSK